MPLGDTIDEYRVQEKTGINTSSTSHTVSLDAGTTAGGSVLVLMASAAVSVTGMPAGFAHLTAPAVSGSLGFLKSNVGAGETSWSGFTFTGAGVVTWYVIELSDHVAVLDPYDSHGNTSSTVSNGGTAAASDANQNAGSWGAAFAWWTMFKVGGTDTHSLDGYTNGFTELVETGPGSGTTGRYLAVAFNTYESTGTISTTPTLTSSVASTTVARTMLRLRSVDASINAPLDYVTTFGFGTHAGMASDPGGTGFTSNPQGAVTPASGTWGTHYAVGAYGRDGRTGLQLSHSASAVTVYLPTVAFGRCSFGGNVSPVSGSGTPTVLKLNTTSSNDLFLLYDVATEKFGLQWVSGAGVPGTAVWQTGTSPVGGGHVWVDIRMSVDSTNHSAAWSIETGTGDGTQTSPTDAAGTTQGTVEPILGSSVSQTGVFRWSDVVFSRYAAAYPLHPHIVRVLTPETTGATVSGTSSNFQRFTNNGTLANVSGTEGALLDDIPPTISASSDGVVQVAVAASDYLNLPMTTYTLAADEIIAGVRAFASLWGGTGSGTGTLGFRGHDGTTETTFFAAGALFDPDSLTTASGTYPMWYTGMWGVGSRWDQTKLNAAALRVGFSTDATPDMGVSCVGLEVATRYVDLFVRHRLVDGEDPDTDPDATVEEGLHPYSSGERFFRVTNNHPTLSVTFRFYESGGEHASSPIVLAPSDPPEDVTIGGDLHGDTVVNTTFGWS
jgi:hypothetical protein